MKRRVELFLRQILGLLLFFSAVATAMLAGRFVITESTRLGFLLWNLMLAWIPTAAALWFIPTGRSRRPILSIFLLLVWFLFLPNTFYILSDFIHLRSSGDINVLYDVVLLFSYAVLGFALGLVSLGVMHSWFRRTFSELVSASFIYGTIFLCSFAIYLGRYLRWNSWDIVTNPLGLLVDISDRVVAPLDHPKTLSTTFIFFVFIALTYSSFWWLAHRFSSLSSREV
ncbi:MAG: DUF1361 domain-containing protein [Patescibacteria group bacterium]